MKDITIKVPDGLTEKAVYDMLVSYCFYRIDDCESKGAKKAMKSYDKLLDSIMEAHLEYRNGAKK